MPLASSRRDVVVVGASAGGVPALMELFSALPASLRATVLVVQHLPPPFGQLAARDSPESDGLNVRAAEDGMRLRERNVYMAVAGRHLIVEPGSVRLTRGPRECRMRPSIDALFTSATVTYSTRVIGVVLSGTLDDGTAGAWAVKDRGGLVLVQDPSCSEYPSMPKSAIEYVSIDFVGNPALLAQQIVARCDESVPALHHPSVPAWMACESQPGLPAVCRRTAAATIEAAKAAQDGGVAS